MNKIYSAANISTRLRPTGLKDDIVIGNGSGCRQRGYFGLWLFPGDGLALTQDASTPPFAMLLLLPHLQPAKVP